MTTPLKTNVPDVGEVLRFWELRDEIIDAIRIGYFNSHHPHQERQFEDLLSKLESISAISGKEVK